MARERRNATFGANVHRLRKQREMSQVELAEKLNVKQTDISRWERGAVPSLDTIIRIGLALQSSVDDLLCGIDLIYDASRRTPSEQQRRAATPRGPELTADERELIDLWRHADQLPPPVKKSIRDMLLGGQKKRRHSA